MREPILESLKEFVIRELLRGQGDGLDENTPLIELGLINSMSIMMIEAHIAKTFGVRVPMERLTTKTLANLKALAAVVQDVVAQKPGSN